MKSEGRGNKELAKKTLWQVRRNYDRINLPARSLLASGLILSVSLLCWQIGRLLESLDNVYRREEILYRIRTGGMIDFNRQIKPKRRGRL